MHKKPGNLGFYKNLRDLMQDRLQELDQVNVVLYNNLRYRIGGHKSSIKETGVSTRTSLSFSMTIFSFEIRLLQLT